MKTNFDQIMSWLAEYEGGYVNHPRDPGGATNRGVTQRVYDAYRRRKGQSPRSVRQLTDNEHDAIYLAQYWMPVRGDHLAPGVDASVFDMAVHSGVSRAVKTLQRVLGVKADGVIGEITLAALDKAIKARGVAPIIIDFNKRRMSFLRRLSTFSTFGRGWTRRVVGQREGAQTDDIGVVDRSVMLAAGAGRDIPKPRGSVKGRAEDFDLSFIGRLIEAFAAVLEALFQKKGVA